MSGMLEQAIIDAGALKEAAIKNAEQLIVEKYSADIKEAVDNLLEQDEIPEEEVLGPNPGPNPQPDPVDSEFAEQVPSAATAEEKLCPCPDDEASITINFDQLAEQIALEEEDLTSEGMEDREEISEELVNLEEGTLRQIIDNNTHFTVNESNLLDVFEENLEEKQLEEELYLTEEDFTSVLNEIEPNPSASSVDLNEEVPERVYEQNIAEVETALHEAKRHKKHNKKLQENYNKLENVAMQMKEKLSETILANSKFYFINRILDSGSLNERQKIKIVESIKKARSAEEAKTIFETLQSAVGSASQKAPKSLNEVVSRKSSAFLPQKEKKGPHSFAERMQVLAGIKYE